MGGLSIWHWLIVLIVVLVLFGGGGRISTLMGDVAKGLKSFKKNMADDESGEGGTPSHSTHIPSQIPEQIPTQTPPQMQAPSQMSSHVSPQGFSQAHQEGQQVMSQESGVVPPQSQQPLTGQPQGQPHP
ncbi:MAG: twin-arginine translocase TatA/TatE family subunit [Acetobacter sp.]|nr:twin-arginine translocase TatA/TatE family subunit [Acetobacter sp.]